VVHTSVENIDAVALATRIAANEERAPANGEDTPEASGATTPVASSSKDEDDDEGGDEGDAEQTGPMKNARLATEADGLVTVDQLEQLARDVLGDDGMFSCYGSTSWAPLMEGAETFGDRGGRDHIGSNEPAWTIFSP
jgi:hypothetical protein